MYCVDTLTGEAVFELEVPRIAREVLLECFNQSERFCVPMQRQESRWIARMALASGWFFYRFKVDGRPRWDRGTGTARTADGRRFSLAVISRSRR